MKTRTFGLAPSNTTLTIEYIFGGAIEHNVPVNSVNRILEKNYTNSTEGVDSTLSSNAEQSLNVTNLERASGGASEETLDEVKLNASAFFNAQNRAVTRADYITRVYSLPQKYGNIAIKHLLFKTNN